jgi:hypothetical protein
MVIQSLCGVILILSRKIFRFYFELTVRRSEFKVSLF